MPVAYPYSNTVPTLRFAGIEIPLNEGWTDTYKNRFTPFLNQFLSHPSIFFWQGGEVTPVTFDVLLVAGIHPQLPDAQSLHDLVEKVIRYALPVTNGTVAVDPFVATINGWWGLGSRRFLIESVSASWKPPYASNGMPMSCKLTMTLLTTYQTSGTEITPVGKLPTRGTFQL